MITFEAAAFPPEEPPTLIRRRPAGMERRRGARLPIEVDIQIEGAALRFDATTGDLSSGGLFVLTHRTIPLGTHVMLGFTLPNDVSLEVLAVVAWQHTGSDESARLGAPPRASRGPGLGLSFFCLDPSVKALLERFCSTREALYYSDTLVDRQH